MKFLPSCVPASSLLSHDDRFWIFFYTVWQFASWTSNYFQLKSSWSKRFPGFCSSCLKTVSWAASLWDCTVHRVTPGQLLLSAEWSASARPWHNEQTASRPWFDAESLHQGLLINGWMTVAGNESSWTSSHFFFFGCCCCAVKPLQFSVDCCTLFRFTLLAQQVQAITFFISGKCSPCSCRASRVWHWILAFVVFSPDLTGIVKTSGKLIFLWTPSREMFGRLIVGVYAWPLLLIANRTRRLK